MSFFAIPTLAGQAAIADAIANGTTITIASMVVGDGNGSAVTPVETQTGLVHLLATVAIQSVDRDTDDPTRIIADAILDENTGGFTIREAGLVDDDGVLLFVASIPATEKQTLAEGVFDVLTLGLVIVVSDAANVTVGVTQGAWATQEYVDTSLENWRTHVAQPLRPYFVAVDSMTLATPPSVPVVGATYVVPQNGAGIFSGHDYELAQFRGNAGWKFAIAPVGTVVAVTVSGTTLYHRRTSTGYRALFATVNETKAGTATDLFVNPAGLMAAIDAAFPPDADGVLYNDGTGALSWIPKLDIHGLSAKVTAANADEIPIYDSASLTNKRITIQTLTDKISISDYVHSEMFFLGSM